MAAALSVTLVFTVALGLWWGRVALALGIGAGLDPVLSGMGALVAAMAAMVLGQGLIARGAGPVVRASRGFAVLGLSLGLGALPLAVLAMRSGQSAGAATGHNPFGTIFGSALAPILAGNLMAGVTIVAAALAAGLCLLLSAVFGAIAPRR
ncbi:hypothetical protein [Acidimangrovimonas sediminis]|uniref:hypothetical protein n=1 Tax=Acidimangrovimonas sediminis TaxID=2056283 RepID=UPI000C808D45|nr:hypothetical protein [Acidimangrovimonas sediminis]